MTTQVTFLESVLTSLGHAAKGSSLVLPDEEAAYLIFHGRAVETAIPQGLEIRFGFDGDGRLGTVFQAEQAIASFSYDGTGALSEINSQGLRITMHETNGIIDGVNIL